MKRAVLVIVWLFVLVAALSAQAQNQSPKKSETLWEKVLRIAGVSKTTGSLRGDEEVTTGDIWWVMVSEVAIPQRITRGGGYYSPVFEAQGQSVLALKGGDLYRVSFSGTAPVKLHTLAGVRKLVGLSRDDPDQLLVVGEDLQQHLPFAGLVSVQAGTMVVIPHNPHSSEDQATLAYLAGWERDYDGTRVYTEKNEKEGPGGMTIEFTDVYMKRGSNSPINLTHGNRISSSQPSLSRDGQKVAFIRGER